MNSQCQFAITIMFQTQGISTSAGIADFRSGINTILETGAGKWAKNAAIQQGKKVKKSKRNVDMMKAYPTPSHMTLCALQKKGYLKYLISQNTDGLHRRSGFPIDKLSELHGNRYSSIANNNIPSVDSFQISSDEHNKSDV